MRLVNPTRRRTEAHVLLAHHHAIYFSYSTAIAYKGPATPHPIRVENRWGPTTGRHITEMGLRDFTIVDERHLAAVLRGVLT